MIHKMGISFDYYELDGYIVRVQKGFKWDGKITGNLLKNFKIEKENENGSWENYPFPMDFISWGKKLEEYTPISDK